MRTRTVVIAVCIVCATVAASVHVLPGVQDVQSRVVDAEGKGIADVYYYAEFGIGRFIPLPLDHGGPRTRCIHVASGMTDADGYLTIERPESLFKHILLALNPFLDISVKVVTYKRGYAPLIELKSYDDTLIYYPDYTYFIWGRESVEIKLPDDRLNPEDRLKYLRTISPSQSANVCESTVPEVAAEVVDRFRTWIRPEVEALMPRWAEDRHLKGSGPGVSPSIREFVVDVLGYDPLPPPENKTQGKSKPASPKCEDEPINSAR